MTTDPEILNAAKNKVSTLDAAELSRSTELTQVDLAAIAGISTLESISFIGGHFDSYEPLSKLPNLTTLALNHWSAEDLTSVGKITQLRHLDLCDNQEYASIEFLAKLVNLEILNLSDGQFSDLSPIRNLPNLRVLNLTNCDEISDFSPLSSIHSLEELHLVATGIADLTPIAKLKKLKILNIQWTEITDLAPLSELDSGLKLLLDPEKEYENRP